MATYCCNCGTYMGRTSSLTCSKCAHKENMEDMEKSNRESSSDNYDSSQSAPGEYDDTPCTRAI